MVKKGTDMKKNAVLFFFKSLLKSILVIVSILAVGVISYKVSYQYLSKQLEAGKLDVQEKELESILDQAKTDEISKNLIYVVNDKQMITHMMLEIWQHQDKQYGLYYNSDQCRLYDPGKDVSEALCCG